MSYGDGKVTLVIYDVLHGVNRDMSRRGGTLYGVNKDLSVTRLHVIYDQ